MGFGKQAQSGVAGTAFTLDVPAGVERIQLTVVLTATGIDALDGWSKPLDVEVANLTAAEARFALMGRTPQGPEPVHLTTLEARYLRDGAIIGSASCPMVIGPPTMTTLNTPERSGLARTAAGRDGGRSAAGDAGRPHYRAGQTRSKRSHGHLLVPAALTAPAVGSGRSLTSISDRMKTFAKTVVDRVRQFSSHDIVSNLLESVGDVVAERLPAEVMTR